MTMSPKFDLERKIKQDLKDLGISATIEQDSILMVNCAVDRPVNYLYMTVDQARSLGATLLDLVFKAKGLR